MAPALYLKMAMGMEQGRKPQTMVILEREIYEGCSAECDHRGLQETHVAKLTFYEETQILQLGHWEYYRCWQMV